MEKQNKPLPPQDGYILPNWGSKNAYRATAHAYMKREKCKQVKNRNSFFYSIDELEKSIINFFKKRNNV